MTDLVLYLGFTLIGVVLGTLAKKKEINLGFTGKIQTVAITCLVFCMGLRMGSNEEVIGNLGSIGIYALVFTIITLVLVISGITLTRKIVGIDRFGRKVEQSIDAQEIQHQETGEKSKISGMTVAIVVSVAIGMVVGYLVIRPAFASNYDEFDSAAGLAIVIGLCILLLFVGIDIGMAGTVASNFKKVGVRIFAFPIATIITTLLAGLISSLILPITMKEGLAISAGFGWYTLAPGIIMEAGFVTASAISFMHNVMRELFSILLIPLVAKKIGYVETTGMPGAAAMDVCLPIVERATTGDVAVYSFVSGVILSFLVPVLVPLILAL